MTLGPPSRPVGAAASGLFALFLLLPLARPQAEPKLPRPVRDRLRDSGGPALRAIDGTGLSRANPQWGAAGIPLTRWASPAYADGMSAPAGDGRPSPRAVSELVCREDRAIANPRNASSFVWQWGQFLDHDLDLTGPSGELFPIAVPAADQLFDPLGTGVARMAFFRSVYDPESGHLPSHPRQQMNLVTACIDASNVYGSSVERATVLRALDGSGRLRTAAGGLLPFNVEGMPNDGGSSADLFLAGDVRANEQVVLTAMHTLFVREHNRLARMLQGANPRWSGERIYQRARSLVGAEMQAVTYREFLPVLLGPKALAPYAGYRENTNPSISNIFSTAAYRVGHSMLNASLLRLNSDGRTLPQGPLPLAEAFFRPDLLETPGAFEALLRGLAAQRARAVDPFITDAVRNFLFGAPGQGGFDLAALNIQRGRDHGLPDYNSARVQLGLAAKTSFATISSNPDVQRRLEEAYGSPDDIDPWIGGLAEDTLPDALVGEFFFAVLKMQFERLRDGDPFWYERRLDSATREWIESLTLSRIIRLNSQIAAELPEDVFRAPDRSPF